MPDPTDVTADSSPAAEEPTIASTATEGVISGTDGVVEDRPLKNLQAEFNRKFSRVEQQYSELATMLQQALQPKPAAPPVNSLDQYSNEQLAQLAQAGSAEAQQRLTERLVQTQVQTATAQQQQIATLRATHGALYARYPQLQDPSHPLTQYAMRAKNTLLQQGYPNNILTDVEAIKIAVVDNAGNPNVVGGPQGDPTRRAQSTIDGSTTRRVAPQTVGGKRKLSEKEIALAKRMGAKDPEGAASRFEKRQAEGRSSLGAVAMHVRDTQ